MKRKISVVLSLAMLMGSMHINIANAEQSDSLTQLQSAEDSAALVAMIKELDSDSLTELGIDTANFNLAEYPSYIGDELFAKKDTWTDNAAFKEDFDTVTEKYVPTVEYLPNDEAATGNYWRAFTTLSLEELKALGTAYNSDKQLRIFIRQLWGTNATVPGHGFETYIPYTINENKYIIAGSLSETIYSWSDTYKYDLELTAAGYTNDAVPETVLSTTGNITYNGTADTDDPDNDALYTQFKSFSDSFTAINSVAFNWNKLTAEDVTKTHNFTIEELAQLFCGNGETNFVLKMKSSNSSGNPTSNQFYPYKAPITLTYDYTIKAQEEKEQYEALQNSVWEKINVTDAAQLSRAIKGFSAEESAAAGIDLSQYSKLRYPVYAAKKMLEVGYTNLAEFKPAFDAGMEYVIGSETVTMQYMDDKQTYMKGWGYSAQDLPNSSNPYKGRKGLAPNWGTGENGSWKYLDGEGTYLYLTFNEVNNKNAIIGGTLSLNVQDQKNLHTVYANRFTGNAIPDYTNTNYHPDRETEESKIALANEVMQAWETYAEEMTVDTEPTTFTYTGVSESSTKVTVTENVSSALLEALNTSKTGLTIQVDAKDTDNNTVVNMAGAVFNLIVDKTVEMSSNENEYAQLITSLNNITEQTADDSVRSFIEQYIGDIATDTDLLNKFNNLANSVQNQIIRSLAAEQMDDIILIQNRFNSLAAAAKDVATKYNIISDDFANWHDATGHDVDGDGQDDEYIGWISTVAIEKLTNSNNDFTMIIATYKNNALTDVQIADRNSIGSVKASYDNMKAAKDGETINFQTQFFTMPEPDAIKIFILTGFEEMTPIAEVYGVADTKKQG